MSSSVIASVQDDDHHFMEKVEPLTTQIKSLSKKVETVPLTAVEPQLLMAKAVSTDFVVRYLRPSAPYTT